ncbi:MAG: type IV pilus secretin PilQ [Deltaproteobacteria bacterium]|nr:type IV pilus secretin PilQ [Deltaproteobacteria bacterium]
MAASVTLVLVAAFWSPVVEARALNMISKLSYSEQGDTTVLRLRCSSKPMFSVFKLERPQRLTIDLANSELRGVASLIDIDSWVVSQLATTQFRTNATTIARVMINFRRRAHYDVRTSGREVVIKVIPYKARPKRLGRASTADLARAHKAEQRAQRVAAKAQAMVRAAQAELERLDQEATRARRDAAHAQAQMETTKRKMAKLSKQARRTQHVEAQLSELTRQARSARLDAKRARSIAARAQKKKTVQQAEVARRVQVAEARSASLVKEAKEAKEALLVARHAAQQAKFAARSARQTTARAQADATTARAEAKKQQALAAERRMALTRALKKARESDAELRASRRESQQHVRRVRRLKAEVVAARRASKGAKASSAVAGRLQSALSSLSEARTEARQAGHRLRDVRRALKLARTERVQAERLRREAEGSRLVAERARVAADRARAKATQQRVEERVRRQAAEQAQKTAARQTAALKRAATLVSKKEQRLAAMTRRVGQLKRALGDSQRREKSQGSRVRRARRALEQAQARSRRVSGENQRLESALTSAQRAQGRLTKRLGRTKQALASQQKQARVASAAVSRWRRAEAEAREKVVNAQNAQARRRALVEARKVSRQLRVARDAARSAKLASKEALAEVKQLEGRRTVLSVQARRAGERLKASRKHLKRIDDKLAATSTRLGSARATLAKISSERRREEVSRGEALRARRQEETRLARARRDRRHAEAQRRRAEVVLGKSTQRLKRTKSAREAEEARLSRLVQKREQARARLAKLQSAGERKEARLAGLGKEVRKEQAKLTALKRRWKAPKVTKATAVRNISFADKRRFAEVHIRLVGDARPVVHREKGQLVLELRNAQLPRLLRRTLDTSAFEGPVKGVSSFVTGDKEPRVFVKVDLRSATSDKLVRVKDGLVWRFQKPPRFAASPSAKKTSATREARRGYSFRTMPVAAANTRRTHRFKRRRYSGRRIDLDFKDADIHNILRLLSQVGNMNIVTSDDVRGKVTIRMRNVPWDQALDVVLRAKGLGQVREGNLVRVAPMADLEKEREAEIARQKQVVLLQPLETRLIPLSYAEAGKVLPKLQYTLSPRGKLTFDDRTNMVIARDIPSNLNLMEKMIRSLDTQTPQVMIEARIIEARTNYVKEIGIQWGGSFLASGANGNSTGLAFPNQIGVGGGATDNQTPTAGLLFGQDANPNFAVNMPAAVGANSGGALGLTLGSISGVFNVNLRLSAAETRGDIRIVSAPRVTTLDNVQAKIEQGVTIPFSQVSAAGVQTTFKDAKLSLTVKPHVTADGSIIMKVKVERNEPDFTNTGARGQPTILKKQADTEMLVKDGDTAVIGGIYTTRDGRSWQKVPWFADIPVIGWFFKTRRDVSDREEVLVFITPRIINRAQSIGRRALAAR